uniref:Uncharacterized protein n=1 Tax=Pectinophora gossypiella TaxID=13191 RepID=A0A1E1W860_PECGO
MISAKIGLILFFSALALCEPAFVDTLPKCSIKDFECLRGLYQDMMTRSADGIPEIGMAPTDPFILKNETVSVLDMVHITMVDGVAKGVKNCIINKVRPDLDTKNFTMDFTCDWVIKGKYKVTSEPAAKEWLGGEVKGEGYGKVEIEKLRIKAGFEFFVRKDNGEVYLDYSYHGMKFAYQFGGIRLHTQNDFLYIGDQELSKQVISIFNDNWKFFISTFGRPFVLKGMDFFFNFTHIFYDNVPAKHFIIEDLSSYL